MINLGRALERAGSKLHYEDSGGERWPIVFTHGAGMDHRMFDAQATALHAAGYRVVRWDLRGHGVSTLAPGVRFDATAAMDDLAALLDHLALDRPVLVGHSLGGNISQALVRRLPGRVGALIVVGSTWNAGPLTRLERFLLGLAAPSLALIPASRLPGLMARASAVTPVGIAEAEATFGRMPKALFLDVWRATASLVAPEPGYRTPVPLGLIRGGRDRTGNIATAMPRWAVAEGTTERVIPDAGHLVTLDAPDTTTHTIRALLDGWERDTGGIGGGSTR
ncbi:alpha/beta hydrolase [Micromonospora polyrhachis]|uniref:Pimeloyl-ACP methyl ester carboxylesterase n=1 Tax=Micromonospora polyrhachis TaxID=1282883 RepID=A0A7W7SL26_9ACTN|nr:alpha/beta hydrolase [Micromonospora polyrhachis]MBB4956694.1 pimeloyl-ACP methyl ester carboxylesterase [Micromonospora polyrhachis]